MSAHAMDESLIDIKKIDLTDPLLYSQGEPHAVWRKMRHSAPVHWQQVNKELGFWSITKYKDVVHVLKDYETFTSEQGTLLNLLGIKDPAGGKQLAATDPPRHGQIRRPLQRGFNQQPITNYEQQLRTKIRTLLIPCLEPEGLDFAHAMFEISIAVSGCILGLPEEDWPLLTRLVLMSIAPDDKEYQLPEGSKATLEQAHRELFAYFLDIVSQRRRFPGKDLISVLTNVELDGIKMDTGAIISNCYSLILGATATTPHAASLSFLEIIKQNLYHDFASHPECMDSAMEEVFRWSSPASHFMRYATQDTEINGIRIRQGDAVVVWLGSANRDEDIFDDPYTFDIRRTPNPHIAFGSGSHYCIGHKTAKQTLTILFEEIFAHYDNFEIIGSIEYLGSNFISGIKHMPIRGYAQT
ncbi:putative cytochrome P450 126 [Paenibacillus nuruki]|uniref:Putative cytochrome P450 126 n=1 Tax=Paenibacillus nuruki TaxID=1886670 RepID=A0A1E3LB12_9BACL|nr:cytochrome P450 [Paenibacillus nuruki]ODP30120.1 putative cytochrome P450 126 [Paenibacillus nuruki]